MNRRKFLAIAGGGVVLAAGAGLGAYVSREPTTALQPWKQAGAQYTEPRKRALSYAILAPNPHNQQPWLVDLSTPNRVILTVDPKRMLPHTDPFNRQITIGLGCFLELMRMAAAEDGYRVDLDLFPEGSDAEKLDNRPVAVATFTRDDAVNKDPLFAHVLERRSLKEPYDLTKPVEKAVLDAVTSAAVGSMVSSSNSEENIAALRQITRDALIVETITPRTFKESVDLFRIGKAEIEANPDGIDLGGPLLQTLALFGMLSREGIIDPDSSQFQQGLDSVLANADTAMAHLWQVTPTNSRIDQIAAGRDWVRLNLAATGQGVGMQPLSQALQEYEEMKELYETVHKRLAPGGGTVQMLARLGYAADVPPSPRWPLSAKTIKG